ncbi:MAG: hypothetical protein H5T85_02045 [Actinobacteria bacterium]|nr:hypothetical protein [Actinomycetota bacterium]
MEEELSIANLSWLTKKDNFLLQFSKKSKKLDDFIENTIPKNERSWLSDLESWEIKNKWLLKVSDICLKEYDQVFFDYGEELYDLKDPENYQRFREKLLEEEL